jgi:peptidoglycan-N-acetylglucosamine deacetylase
MFLHLLAPVSAAAAGRIGVDRTIPGDGVALTFDDGPHPQATPRVLETLAARDAKATFFLVGEQVERYPALARRIVAEGHEIAVHGYRHTFLLRRRLRAIRDDLDRAEQAISSAAGAESILYRPPYGVISEPALDLVRERGWRAILWSRWGRDWERRATPQSIARRATRGLRPGDVLLLHDSDAYSSECSWARTAAALPSVLSAVAELGVPADAVTHST